MSDNWDKDLPFEGMKAKVNRKMLCFFFARAAKTRSTTQMLFILHFLSDPQSEPESEPTRSPDSESESESEQPHHDSAPLTVAIDICVQNDPENMCRMVCL